MSLEQITNDLVADLDGLTFGPPVTHVYNPLVYARASWDTYCERFGKGTRDILFFGMNPGPWGMAQTGIPFGEIGAVRDWLGIDAPIGKPDNEHPKRQIVGLECTRSEVSGRRLWGWARDAFGTPEAFFERCFVGNYCPLVWMEDTGRNRVPEKLPKAEREPVFAACDKALRRMIEHFSPKQIIGVGKFAEKRAANVAGDMGIPIGSILHPSPASPKANQGWEAHANNDIAALGIDWPGLSA